MIGSFRQYLVEENKIIVFSFGRMNPPTIGHEKLLDAMAKTAGRNPYRMYLSQSQDPKKNPLSYKDKVKIARKMFPRHARSILKADKIKNLFQIATSLYDEGFRNVVMVVGSDRVNEFDILLRKYNGKKGTHGFYNFMDIKVVSAGERDPDAEGASGMSASKMRAAASDDDFTKFSLGIPKGVNNAEAKKIFNMVRKGMGLKEQTEFKRHIQLDPVSDMREAYVDGGLYSVGDQVIIKENEEVGVVAQCASNYLIIEQQDGKRVRKWLDAVEPVEEKVSSSQITGLERFADKLLGKYGIDVEFTRHFADRMNDARNNPDIKVAELQKFFKKVHKAKGNKIKSIEDMQAVLKDLPSDLNMPVVIRPKGDDDIQITLKTIMRKKDFKTPNQVISYEAKNEGLWDNIRAKRARGEKMRKKGEKGAPTPDQIARAQETTEERDYKKEYENYQGKPEQVARRSSRNKARRAMTALKGSKAVKGKDIGHKDNNPMNNDPTNLRTEDPSKNRREPRLRNEAAQDPDIKDKEGTQPKKYYAGLAKSTKDKRDAHFKKYGKKSDSSNTSYKPAPGDADAKTKPSKHTLRFKQMFGETVASDRAKARIEREKAADAKRHDRMMDRARLKDTKAKNKETK
jgi:hypothetical protein